MEYRKVYFRIKSRYEGYSGWPDEEASTLFQEESRKLFQESGWELHPGRNGVCDVVTKGRQDLYLHPMNFSGVIRMDEVPKLRELLGQAVSFTCYGVDCYEEYLDLTDEEYLERLKVQREEITAELLKQYQTKRRNLYITTPVALRVAKRFSVHRLCDKEDTNDLANRFVEELVEQMLRDGHLVMAKTRHGAGIRAAARLPNQEQNGSEGQLKMRL